MVFGFDIETSGLDEGSDVHVVSLYDSRMKRPASFQETDSDSYLIMAIDALETCDTLCSFNGTSFDLKRISERLGTVHDKKRAARLALGHYDIMLDFATRNGYMASLASFATPTLNTQKICDGESATTMWQNGERDKVREYCEDDARITADLFEYGLAYGRLKRQTKSGKMSPWVLGQLSFRKACSALRHHRKFPPNTSWMTDPPEIQAMAAWTVALLTPQ